MKNKINQPPRLLIFTLEFFPFRGGVAAYNDNLIRGLSELGFRIDVLTAGHPSGKKEESRIDRRLFRKCGIRVYRKILMTRAKLLQWCFYIITHILLIKKPDIILIPDDAAQRIASLIAVSRFRIPYYITVHGSEIYSAFSCEVMRGGIDGKLFPWLKHRAETFFEKAHGVIFVSRFTRDLFKCFYTGSLRKHEVVHNGIDEDILLSEGEVKRKRNSAGEKVTCITVSRIDPRKNHEAVLYALARMPEDIRKRVLYKVAGTGEYLNRLRLCAQRLDLTGQVVFLNELTEAEKLSELDKADIFVMPSKQVRGTVEGLGISFLEASARGLPLIGGRHGGVPEVIDDHYNGFLVDPEDIREIAAVLKKLVMEPDLRLEMGLNSWRKVKENFLRMGMAAATADFLSTGLKRGDGKTR